MDIRLTDKFEHEKINKDEMYREVLVYQANDKIAHMMAVIEHDGLVRTYNMDSNAYFNCKNQEDYSDVIQENILNKLEGFAMKQVKDDYVRRQWQHKKY